MLSTLRRLQFLDVSGTGADKQSREIRPEDIKASQRLTIDHAIGRGVFRHILPLCPPWTEAEHAKDLQ